MGDWSEKSLLAAQQLFTKDLAHWQGVTQKSIVYGVAMARVDPNTVLLMMPKYPVPKTRLETPALSQAATTVELLRVDDEHARRELWNRVAEAVNDSAKMAELFEATKALVAPVMIELDAMIDTDAVPPSVYTNCEHSEPGGYEPTRLERITAISPVEASADADGLRP